MATHCSILAWRIPWTGEPGGLQSMGSHRVGHDLSDSPAVVAAQKLPFVCVLWAEASSGGFFQKLRILLNTYICGTAFVED